MEKEYTCRDCENLITIDVFEGLCDIDKKINSADKKACDKFKFAKKCKFCLHYSNHKEFLGKCKNKVLTYPDLSAKECKDFKKLNMKNKLII